MTLASRGFSKRTLLVQLRNSRALPAEIALRVDRAFNFLGTTVSDEFAPLVALYEAGIRLPRPFALESTGKVLDGPFIIFEKRTGSLVGNNFQAPRPNAALATDVAKCLAQVHRTPVSVVPPIHGAGLSAEDQVREDLDKSYADFSALRHPVPVMETSVRPPGRVSVTVTVPVVGPALAAFETKTVKVAPCWPWVKSPAWLFVMESAAGGGTVTTACAGGSVVYVAVIVACPGPTAVTRPAALTVATATLDDENVTPVLSRAVLPSL